MSSRKRTPSVIAPLSHLPVQKTLRWRAWILLGFVAATFAARLFGVATPLAVPLLLVVWAALIRTIEFGLWRAREFDAPRWAEHAALTLDPVFLTSICYVTVPSHWVTVAFYTIAVSTALEFSAARAARQAEAHCRILVEGAMDMVMILDASGRMLSLNSSAQDQTGHASDEIAGRRFQDLLLVADRDAWTELLMYARLGDRGSFTLRFLRGDGAQRWMSGSVMPVSESKSARLVVIARDVTEAITAADEQERMRAELTHAQKMESVGQLVSGVAHELNNPLTVVMNRAQELLGEARSESDAEGLSVIVTQARRCRAIVRDLLSFARKRAEAVVRQSYVAPVIDQVVRGMQPVISRSGVHVTTRVDGRIPPVALDSSAVEQVLTNLLTNAVHAAGPAGRVTIAARALDDGCEIMVEDSGPGLSPEVLPRIFEPFFTTKPVGEGTGLGLPLALGVLKQAGGSLRADNRGEGTQHGAMFTATIPYSDKRLRVERRPRADDVSFDDPTTSVADRPRPQPLSVEAEVTRQRTGKPHALHVPIDAMDSITGDDDRA